MEFAARATVMLMVVFLVFVVGGVLLCIHVIFTYSKEPKPEEKP